MNEYIILFYFCVVCFVTGYGFGWRFGERRGRDTQWIDDFLANARREAARRDKLGRFKERNT